MSDDISDLLEAAFDRIRDLEDGHAALIARHERMFRYGKILDTSDIDLSDPTNPVARIHHDDDDDGAPVKGPFVRYASWAGDRNQHTPPSPGQQFLHISPDGEMEGGLLVPLGHSTAIPSPETDGQTHVDQFGQVKRTLKQDSLTHTVGGVQLHTDTKDHKVTAPGKVQIAAGDPAAANSSGAGSLTNFPHELNRVVQGALARLDQHDHHFTAIHDQVSTMVDKLVGLCPPLLDQQQNTLNHKADGLKKAAEQAQGMLPEYSASAIQQAVTKLLASPLGAVSEIVRGDIAGQMGGLLGQIGSMIGGAGLSGGAGRSRADVLGPSPDSPVGRRRRWHGRPRRRAVVSHGARVGFADRRRARGRHRPAAIPHGLDGGPHGRPHGAARRPGERHQGHHQERVVRRILRWPKARCSSTCASWTRRGPCSRRC